MHRKVLWIILGVIVIIFIFVFYTPTTKTLLDANRITLPADIQKSIQNEAVNELKGGVSSKDADVITEVDNEDVKTAETAILPNNPIYIFKKLGRRIQEFFTFDPLLKANLILKHNSSEMVETLAFLQKGGSADIVASQIAEIENRFNETGALGFSYAEKYFRYELILKELEEKLDDNSFVKIESARLKNLGIIGKILTSYHPDPEVLSRELAKSLSNESGIDYKEFKTAEILQEIEDATVGETQKSALRLAQYILIERFEKKVMALPTAERRQLLNNFVDKISGNPIKDYETFTRIRKLFKSNELIIYAEIYKAKALENFEKRVLALSQNQINDPGDLRILEALELRATHKKDTKLLGIINNLKSKIRQELPSDIKNTNFYKIATTYPDVLDVKISQDFIPSIEKQVENKFISNTNESVQAAIDAEIILDSVEVPNAPNAINDLVIELEQNPIVENVTQNLQIPIDEVIDTADTQITEPSSEEIAQRTQQLTEEIFSAPAGVETTIEEELPTPIQQEIETIQQTTNQVPQVNESLIQTVVNTVQQTAPAAAAVPVIETPPPTTITVPSL